MCLRSTSLARPQTVAWLRVATSSFEEFDNSQELDTYGQGSSTVFIKNLPPLPPYEKRIAEGSDNLNSGVLVTHKGKYNNGLGTH